jgi:phage gpG-like protein
MPRQIPPSQQLNKIVAAIFDELDEAASNETMRDMAEFVASRLRKRARSGRTAKRAGGYLTRLKPLSAKYIEKRRRSKLHPETKPEKSNLTFTGQLLDSITAKIRKGKAVIAPRGRRREGGTNERVSIYVQQQGRPFLFLGRKDTKELIDFYTDYLNDLINSNRTLTKR